MRIKLFSFMSGALISLEVNIAQVYAVLEEKDFPGTIVYLKSFYGIFD